jgi:uncharacterized RDD family membrane protein YckC
MIQGVSQYCDDCTAQIREEEQFRRVDPAPIPAAAPPGQAGAELPGATRACPSCGQLLPMGAAFCPVCGQSISAGGAYAGFWMRFAAAIIDGIILGISQFVVGAVIEDRVVGLGLNLLISFVYTIGFWVAEGATPGKMAMGVKIVSTDGSPITGGQAVLRYFAEWLSALILFIGFFMIAWTPQKRGLHDYIAGTLVIKTR